MVGAPLSKHTGESAGSGIPQYGFLCTWIDLCIDNIKAPSALQDKAQKSER